MKEGGRVLVSRSSGSNRGGDPTKLAAVGGGKKLFSRELCTSNPGTALLSSSITIKLGSVDGALSSSPEDECADEIEAECIEAVVEGGVDEESSVTRVSTCNIKRK